MPKELLVIIGTELALTQLSQLEPKRRRTVAVALHPASS
jgi:hypothetical protein